MKEVLFKKRRTLGGAILGAIVGYVYGQTIACANGTCLISAVWYHSTLIWCFAGWIVG